MLQGVWIVSSKDGVGVGPVEKGESVRIAGDRLTWTMPQSEMQIEYQLALDPGKKPKNIDLTFRSITLKGKPLPADFGKGDRPLLITQYKAGMVFPGVYRLESESLHEAQLELFFAYRPDHLQRPSVQWPEGGGPNFERKWTTFLSMTRVRSEAEKQEYVQVRANGVSMVEERAVREAIDGDREMGPEHAPRYLLWEGAELTDKNGVKRKVVRVKRYEPDLKKDMDDLYWVERGEPEKAQVKKQIPNPLGNDWKTRGAELKW